MLTGSSPENVVSFVTTKIKEQELHANCLLRPLKKYFFMDANSVA